MSIEVFPEWGFATKTASYQSLGPIHQCISNTGLNSIGTERNNLVLIEGKPMRVVISRFATKELVGLTPVGLGIAVTPPNQNSIITTVKSPS